jgi:hypothetical protein
MASKQVPQTERRKHPRFQVSGAKLGYDNSKLFGYNTPLTSSYPVINLSLGGLQFFSTKYLKTDTVIDLRIDCPAFVNPLIGRAKTIWYRRFQKQKGHYAVGLKWIKMNKLTKNQIKELANDPMIRTLKKGSAFIG